MLEASVPSGTTLVQLEVPPEVSPRRGRPRQETPMMTVSIRIPQALYDAYCRSSIHARVSTRSWMRETLAGRYRSTLIRRRRDAR